MLKYSRGKPWTIGGQIHLPKVRCALKGGEAVYITLDNSIQIGIFLTEFTVMIFSIISFFINKKK
ncbi:hypothetical protein EUBSIR_01488 [[Eubacterium] siraeum DSM 15702]|uniref:Uncharacterized protein n=1 Tax=[Eubacterium] siraeum DSM 15702 TaxID=428128 RepID=B0MNT1_9FIRM|nr:hypothetical protein EUBSIR_01488 [[Eubacterium] siraeum DSM 15702]